MRYARFSETNCSYVNQPSYSQSALRHTYVYLRLIGAWLTTSSIRYPVARPAAPEPEVVVVPCLCGQPRL